MLLFKQQKAYLFLKCLCDLNVVSFNFFRDVGRRKMYLLFISTWTRPTDKISARYKKSQPHNFVLCSCCKQEFQCSLAIKGSILLVKKSVNFIEELLTIRRTILLCATLKKTSFYFKKHKHLLVIIYFIQKYFCI